MLNESGPAIATGFSIRYEPLVPAGWLEHPLHKGVIGTDSFGSIGILNLSVCIRRPDLPNRLLAVMSLKDAEKLPKMLLSCMGLADYSKESLSVPSSWIIEQYLNCFGLQPESLAMVIKNPSVEVGSVDLSRVRRPFPEDCVGKDYPIIINGISPVSGEETPKILLTVGEAGRFAFELNEIIGKYKGRPQRNIKDQFSRNPDKMLFY